MPPEAPTPPTEQPTDRPSPPQQPRCIRCGAPAPVDEDGFCAKCVGEVEQACL